MSKVRRSLGFALFLLITHPAPGFGITKIIGIHSYHDAFPWTKILNASYEETFRKSQEIQIDHYYLDVKRQPLVKGKEHPSFKEIESVINKKKPDLVFLTDDYALNLFAKPLVDLKQRFVFAGINGDLPSILSRPKAQLYSGVLERYYIKGSVGLLQRLIEKKKLNLLFLLEDSEVSVAVEKQIGEDIAQLPDVKFKVVITNDFATWKTWIKKNGAEYDAFLPLQPFSLRDERGSAVKPEEVVNWIYKESKKPSVFTGSWQTKCGGSLTIGHRPQAQGELAAKFSIDALNGSFRDPVIPPLGDIEINYASLTKLGIKVPFDILSTANVYKEVIDPCRAM